MISRKFISLIAITALFAAVLTSCDREDESITDELIPSGLQKDAIIAELGKNKDLSEFVDLLKTLDVADMDVDGLTVFAVSNTGMGKSEPSANMVLKRHIVEGLYSKSLLTDSLLLTALDGSMLLITIIEGNYYVNGVGLGAEIPADSSVAYIVDMALPAKPIARYSLTVFECNPAWSPDNNIPYLLASDAVVTLRDDLGNEVNTYTTNSGGILDITLESGSYFYKVTKGAASNISKDGFLISGMFVFEGTMDTIPYAAPGGLILADMNGDGIINDADKPANGFVKLQSVQSVYIAAADFEPTYQPKGELLREE